MKNQNAHQYGLYNQELDRDSCGVGLIANYQGHKSHKLIDDALTMLEHMEHRGACGSDPHSGDGAGILIQIPHELLKQEVAKKGLQLSNPGSYGVAMVFLPKEEAKKQFCLNKIYWYLHKFDFDVLCQRRVEVHSEILGESSFDTEPLMTQFIVTPKTQGLFFDLEKALYFLKSIIMKAVYFSDEELVDDFYIASMSSKTIVYKGQLNATQLRRYFVDLQDTSLTSALAIVHSRFSTNTVPKWKLAQPMRCLAHNGEINTIQGNLNGWKARENDMERSKVYREEWLEALPVCDPYLSDSGNFDNVIDFLIRTTRSIPHAMMMLIPEAWQNDTNMPEYKKGFYAYHDAIIEPWDGPAAICFTDGNLIGATLDRNGLRPLRYSFTTDHELIVASEEGCLPINQEKILHKGRLQPGRMLLADLDEKRIISDTEIKEVICKRHPYAQWVRTKTKQLSDLSQTTNEEKEQLPSLLKRQLTYGMTLEDKEVLLTAMIQDGKEPLGSMGSDIPLAIFSKMSQHISHYFKQQFAQVTNPPIDPIRENFFMSLESNICCDGKILNVNESQAVSIRLKSPILFQSEFNQLKHSNDLRFRSAVISTCYEKESKLTQTIFDVNQNIKEQIQTGKNIIILSDKAISDVTLAIPSLLIVSAVHHFLIKEGLRKRVSLIMDTGDTWEVHHFACLLSYGADAIYPHVAMDTIKSMDDNKKKVSKNLEAYKHSIEKGLFKVMSKLGISTLSSYKGAQTFDIIGLSQEVLDLCFNGIPSRIGGLTMEHIEKVQTHKHQLAFHHQLTDLPDKGQYAWRRNGEYHLFNPKTIHLLQHATRTNNFSVFEQFTKEIDSLSQNASTLRSFIDFKERSPIPLSEVESEENIMKRFASGAMSFGSISKEAHSTLAIAMNRIGAKSNSGEGGEDEKRYEHLPNGDSAKSAIKQVASGRFGVTIQYLNQAKEIQIKMAQGAKPGEGGHLPGKKVDQHIAKVRHSTPGVGLISPPPHHDIYSIEDLAQLIFDLKNANEEARISVKLVSKNGVGVIASGVTKAHADHILISGCDGGTGASPLSSITHSGLPWELGLAETHHTLIKNGLRDRVTLQCDGQIRTGRDLAIATLLGAEEWGVATAALVVEGCILMRKCHLNTCPVGIATQDEDLRKKFEGKVEHLVHYFQFLARDLRNIMASLGFRTINEMVGRADVLRTRGLSSHWKYSHVDLSRLLFYAKPLNGQKAYKNKPQDHGIANVLDRRLINLSQQAITHQLHKEVHSEINNTDRATGTMLSGFIAKRYGSKGLQEESLQYTFSGSAGQSFGAFLIKGIRFNLQGASNDYFGKGLSGGKLVVYPDEKVIFNPTKNTIVGNVSLYGATSGKAFIRGGAGDRFAVRNSGAQAVVESIGDNGCEYMTGGTVIVLGDYGKNFAAGMSGGMAFLYKEQQLNTVHINQEMVSLMDCSSEDLLTIKSLLEEHFECTSSNRALDILNDWYNQSHQFVKVMPIEYQKVLNMSKTNMEHNKKIG